MTMVDTELDKKAVHSCIDDFDIHSLTEIYGSSADMAGDFDSIVGIEDFESLAGREVADINGKIYPSKECCHFMTIPTSYVMKHCKNESAWIQGMKYWVSIAAKGFIEGVAQYGKQYTVQRFTGISVDRWFAMAANDKNLVGSDFIMIPLAMFHNINVRDAILIAILDENYEWYGGDMLSDLAWLPHIPEMSFNLRHFLEAKFNQTKRPDVGRAVKARKLLEAMALIVQEIPELTVQVYALIAYISWWFRLGDVSYYAKLALKIDPECSMAKIVNSANENGVEPAWLDTHATPQENEGE